MVVSNGCQPWLSATIVSLGCRQWLLAMVFPPKTAFFEGVVPNGRHHAPPGVKAIRMVKFSAQTEVISGISFFCGGHPKNTFFIGAANSFYAEPPALSCFL